MTNTQTKWTALGIGITLSLTFLGTLIEFRHDMEMMERHNAELEKRIEKLQLADVEMQEKFRKMATVTLNMSQDIETVQALQRTQANEILDIKKGNVVVTNKYRSRK